MAPSLIKLAVLPDVNCDKMHSCLSRRRGWRIVVGMNASVTSEQAGAAARAGLRQRKKESSRRAIEDAAWELFAEKGYEETSINDIAERADVAPRTFFRYFPTKEAVMYPQFEELLQSVGEEFRKRPADEPVHDEPVRELRRARRFPRGRGDHERVSAWR